MVSACRCPLSLGSRLLTMLFLLASLLVPNGCERKPGVESTLSALQKAFPARGGQGQVDPSASGQAPFGDAAACVQVALAAVRSNDYATAVVMLNGAVRAPGITPDQLLVAQEARRTLVTELENKAEKGDANAQNALKAISQSRLR